MQTEDKQTRRVEAITFHSCFVNAPTNINQVIRVIRQYCSHNVTNSLNCKSIINDFQDNALSYATTQRISKDKYKDVNLINLSSHYA